MRRKNSKVAIVPLKGINTSTPDNTVEDGSCEVLHNMRIKDGAWRNVGNLKFIDSLGTYYIGTYEEARRVVDVLYKHPSASEDSYVVVVEVSYSGEVAGREIVNIANREISHTFFAGEFQEVSVMHLGRLLILNIDGKMSYWRNKENTGNYSPTSLPQPASITLPEKVMRSGMIPFVHTRNWRNNVRPSGEEDIVTYLAPMPIFSYMHNVADTPYNVGVYYPIYSADTQTFVQPSTQGDWWQGEICIFTAFKTIDGHYICPSALTIVSSELDNSGLISDRTIKRHLDDNFNFGVNNVGDGIVVEQGLSGDTITLNMGGRIIGSVMSVSSTYTWIDAASGKLESAIPRTIGIFNRHAGDSSVARRVMANALMCAPMCRVAFENPDKSIDSLVVFSTRLHSRWDANVFKALCDSGRLDDLGGITTSAVEFNKAFADNKLPEQPFYKILEIPRSEWGDESAGHYALDIALTGTLLENAEQKEVWEPINPHELVYSSGKEINSMMHIFGDVSQDLFDGYGSRGLLRGGIFCSPEYPIATSLKIDEKFYCVVNQCGFDLLDASVRKNIISYPDYRAKQMYNGSPTVMRNAYDLSPAIANNYAYHIADIFKDSTMQYFEFADGDSAQVIYYCKFPHRWKDTNSYIDGERVPIIVAFEDGALYGGGFVNASSELRVSALSNPLVFPLSRTYQIGSDDNQIIAINSAAIELSDDKIGEYPTWVFTKEGVFIGHWGEGDDVIYRAFLPRTYDRICNPNTLAVNGSILFITPQGLMSIGERGSQLLSAPLNSLWGKTPKWLIEANVLGWKYDTNEVFISGGDSNIHVLNLGAGLWSTRTKPAEHISKLLANRLLVGGDSQMLYSIQEDGDFLAEESVRILTRPIKMGAYEMKRIETFIARFSANAELALKVTIYGSIDGVKYGVLRQANVSSQSSIRLTHVPMSVRYFKLGLEFPSVTDVVFTSFDIEYYNRFINRLR